MANVKGRGVKVEIAATFSAAKVVTEVTQAATAVATCAAHGLANDSVGYFKGVVGMPDLEGQACRLKNVDSGSFELQGLDTSAQPDYTAGTFVPVASWLTLAESTSYSIPDQAPDRLDTTTLLHTRKRSEPGLLPEEAITFNVISQEVPSDAMRLVESAMLSGGSVLVRITLKGGAVRIAYGDPGAPGEDVQKGALGSGGFTLTVKGQSLKLAA